MSVPVPVQILPLPPSCDMTEKGYVPSAREGEVVMLKVEFLTEDVPEKTTGLGEKEAVAPEGRFETDK
jgi:hypothetical protein